MVCPIEKVSFSLGDVYLTPGVLDALQKSGEVPEKFLFMHESGDWGILGEDDKALNDEALRSGGRILSAYLTGKGAKLYVITEEDRSSTTITLAEEY